MLKGWIGSAEYERALKMLDESSRAEALEFVATEVRYRAMGDIDLIQEDIAAMLRILGLGDHARNKTPHEVVRDEILPILESRQQELEAVHDLAAAYRQERDECRALLGKEAHGER